MSAAMCAICFDFLLDQHENCVVPCGHVFHQKCLSKWFISKRNCPNCQKEVAPNMTVRIFINFHNDQLLNVSKIEKCDQECKDIKAKNRELKTKVSVKSMVLSHEPSIHWFKSYDFRQTADLKTQVSKAIHELNVRENLGLQQIRYFSHVSMYSVDRLPVPRQMLCDNNVNVTKIWQGKITNWNRRYRGYKRRWYSY